MTYLLLIVLVVGINLLPAFGPPTWAVLVYFKINHDMEPVSLVVIGAFCAGAGRWVLAAASERLVPHLSEVRQEKLQAARTLLTRRRRSTAALVVLFLISPLPSAPLFLAAGLMHTPLRPVVGAFVAGRLVTYSLYVGAATVASDRLGASAGDMLGSPMGIAFQLAMLALVAALPLIDWRRFLDRDEQPAAP